MESDDELKSDLRFAVITEWVLFHKEIKPSDKVVWLVLQRFANDDGVCWPGIETIAERSGVSKRQVTYCLDRLRAIGAISIKRRKRWVEQNGKKIYVNSTNVYTVHFSPPEMRAKAPLRVVTDVDDPAAEAADVNSVHLSADSALRGGAESALSSPDLSAEIARESEPGNNLGPEDIHVAFCDSDSDGAGSALRADVAVPARKPKAKRPRLPEVVREDVELLCDTLVEHLLSNGFRKQEIKVNKQWKQHARLLLDKDGATLDEALEVMNWSQHDTFWSKNILSMKTFRDKYPRLRVTAMSGKTPKRTDRGDYLRELAARAEALDAADDAALQLGDGDDDTF